MAWLTATFLSSHRCVYTAQPPSFEPGAPGNTCVGKTRPGRSMWPAVGDGSRHQLPRRVRMPPARWPDSPRRGTRAPSPCPAGPWRPPSAPAGPTVPDSPRDRLDSPLRTRRPHLASHRGSGPPGPAMLTPPADTRRRRSRPAPTSQPPLLTAPTPPSGSPRQLAQLVDAPEGAGAGTHAALRAGSKLPALVSRDE